MADDRIIDFLLRFANPDDRREACSDMAKDLGAEALLVFSTSTKDTPLSHGPGWNALFSQCANPGTYVASVERLDGSGMVSATAVAVLDGMTLVLLGGRPRDSDLQELRRVLPLLSHIVGGERRSREADQTREELLAILGHDVSNPLGALLTSVGVLERLISREPGGAPFLKYAKTIARSGHAMKRLLSDTIDLLAFEGDRANLSRKPESANGLLRDAVVLLRPLASEKRIRLEAVPCSHDVLVDCDKGRVLQLLSNLVTNAVKFTPEGGSVTVLVEAVKKDAQFSVEDTGSGISRDHLPHVFDRQWQQKSMARGGIGLGLAIAKAIAEAHGGRIWVDDDFGPGARFSFALPADAGTVGLT